MESKQETNIENQEKQYRSTESTEQICFFLQDKKEREEINTAEMKDDTSS